MPNMSGTLKLDTPEEKDKLLLFLRTGKYLPQTSKGDKANIRKKCKNLVLVSDQICYKNSENVILKVFFRYEHNEIKAALDQEHNDCHFGVKRLESVINQKYYGISSRVITAYVNGCPDCARYNSLTTIQEINLIPITQKYDRYVVDCVDLRRYDASNSGYKWILNVIDSFTKFLWSYKMKDKTASSVRDCLRNCFLHYGVPVALQADNGKEFANQDLRQLCLEMNIRIIHGRPRNPKAQGTVERVNQTVKRWLAKTLHNTHSTRWIDHLDNVVYKYNISIHQATRQSPFKLFFGRSGFNSVQFIPETDEEGNLIESNIELTTRDNFSAWNLSEVEEISEFPVDVEPVPLPVVDDQLRETVLEHHRVYIERTNRNANSNLVQISFELGEIVLLKLDFDNNTQTRRNPFDSFYDSNEFEVVEILQNKMIKIQNTLQRNDVRNVYKGRIKKLNHS